MAAGSMIGWSVGVVAICAALHPAPASAQATSANLDRFLGGVAACRFPAQLDAFLGGLSDRYRTWSGERRPQVHARARVPIPADLRAAFGAFSATTDGRTTTITAPVRGRFRDLPVRAIELTIGNESGVNVTTVRFDAPRDEVMRVFATEVRQANIRLRRAGGEAGVDKDAAAVVCNRST